MYIEPWKEVYDASDGTYLRLYFGSSSALLLYEIKTNI